MSKFENVNIDYLDKKEQNLGTELNYNELNSYFDDTFFDDLKSDKVKIKKHGNTYTFEQQDPLSSLLDDNNEFKITKFSVKEKVLDKYMKDQEKKENKELDDDYNLIDFFNTISTSKDFGNLKNEVKDDIEKNNNSLESISSLISQYEEYSNLKKKDLGKTKTRDGKETLKDIKKEAKYRVKLLTGIKGDINNRRNTDVYQKDIDTCKRDIPKFEDAIQNAMLGGRGSVPRILHDRKSIEQYSVELQDNLIEDQMINDALHDITLKTLYNRDQLKFEEYLKDVMSGKIEHPAQHPFYTKHEQDFQEIQNKNPALYGQYSWFMKPGDIRKYCTTGPSGHPRQCSSKKSGLEQGGDFISDILVKFGIIDENDPKQKRAWTNAAKIGFLALGAFAIYKIFTAKGKEKWAWAGGLLGGALALGNMDKLRNWYKDAFGTERPDPKAISKKSGLNENISETYVEQPIVVMEALGTIPISTLLSQNIVKEEDGKMKIDADKYRLYVTNNIADKEEQDRLLNNLDKIEKNELLFSEGMDLLGIGNLDELEKIAGNDDKKTILDSPKMGDYFESLSSDVNADLAKEGLKPKNAEAWYKITQEFKEKNKNNNDTQIKNWIEKGLVVLKENEDGQRPPYTAKEMLSNKNLNIGTKTMDYFTGKNGGLIKFEGYSDLFSAVKLTEFIKKTFKDQSVATDEHSWEGGKGPFHTNFPSSIGDIEFNNKSRYDLFEGDTSVINSVWMNNTLKELSPTLNEHKSEYIDYLNKRWKNK